MPFRTSARQSSFGLSRCIACVSEVVGAFVWRGGGERRTDRSPKEDRMFSSTRNGMDRFIQFGFFLLGVLCLMSGPAWADAPGTVSVGTGHGVYTWNPFPDSEPGAFRGIAVSADNVLGPATCSSAYSYRFVGNAEPLATDGGGRCDPTSANVWSVSVEDSDIQCRVENTGQSFSVTFDDFVLCVPLSCYGEPHPAVGLPLPQAGCIGALISTLKATESDGAFETTTQTVEHLLYEKVEWNADRGLVVAHVSSTTAGTITAATFAAPEEDRPARDVVLEVPAKGSTVSGIGLISGWSCLGGKLEAEISDVNGVIASVPLPHGNSRADTGPSCGDTLNGFSATMNWTLLGSGEKIIRLMQNGEAVASRDFSVVAFETEFIRGASGMCSIDDFPSADQSVTVEWDEPQQSFVVAEIR